jgi:voltage-gated potassium channel
MAWCLLALWPVFILDSGLRLVLHWQPRHGWRQVSAAVLMALIPPLRMGAPSYADPERIWLPGLGWATLDKELHKRLERFFSVPMIVIALMILPLLVLHYKLENQVAEYVRLTLFVQISEGLIWLAFALEFVIMVSTADRKLRYCLQQWLNLIIILLPLVEAAFAFLPFLRVLRVGRVMRLQRALGQAYRMRGLMMRAWRAVLLLNLVNRLMRQPLPKRLQRLEEQLAAKEEEVEDLRKEIEELKKQIAQQARTEAPVSAPAERATS